MTRTFEANIYHVMEAQSGEVALDIAARHSGPQHLSLTDMILPQMSGQVLAERLTKCHPRTAVLIMSGYTETIASHYGVLDAKATLMEKPFTEEDLTGITKHSTVQPANVESKGIIPLATAGTSDFIFSTPY